MGNYIIILAILSILISILTAMAWSNPVPGIMVGFTWFVIGLIIYGIWRLIVKSSSFVSYTIKDKVDTIISKNTVDESYYAIAEEEINDATFDKGLWAKALVNVKGNENVRKAEYIRLRAKQLQDEDYEEDEYDDDYDEEDEYDDIDDYEEEDDAEVNQELLKKAKDGEAEAQHELGSWYFMFKGEDCTKSALKWYTKAANQGYSKAQCQLGVIYSGGKRIPQNYEKAIEWYTKAANQENDMALNNLGAMYLNGHGVPQNERKALELLIKSANRGNQFALSTLNRLIRMQPKYREIIEKEFTVKI